MVAPYASGSMAGCDFSCHVAATLRHTMARSDGHMLPYAWDWRDRAEKES